MVIASHCTRDSMNELSLLTYRYSAKVFESIFKNTQCIIGPISIAYLLCGDKVMYM